MIFQATFQLQKTFINNVILLSKHTGSITFDLKRLEKKLSVVMADFRKPLAADVGFTSRSNWRYFSSKSDDKV